MIAKRLRYLFASVCLAFTLSQSVYARATTDERRLMIVDVADDMLPRDGAEVRLFVVIPGPETVTGYLELVVERYLAQDLQWSRNPVSRPMASDQIEHNAPPVNPYAVF